MENMKALMASNWDAGRTGHRLHSSQNDDGMYDEVCME